MFTFEFRTPVRTRQRLHVTRSHRLTLSYTMTMVRRLLVRTRVSNGLVIAQSSWLITIVSCLVAAAVVGCSLGRDGGSGLTKDEQLEVTQVLDRMESNLGFSLVAPTYLPRGLPRTPEPQDAPADGILHYWSDRRPAPPSTILGIQIVERELARVRQCPLFSDPAADEVELKETVAKSLILRSGPSGSATHSIQFPVDHLCIFVDIYWQLDGEDQSPSEAMLDEGFRIAESML